MKSPKNLIVFAAFALTIFSAPSFAATTLHVGDDGSTDIDPNCDYGPDGCPGGCGLDDDNDGTTDNPSDTWGPDPNGDPTGCQPAGWPTLSRVPARFTLEMLPLLAASPPALADAPAGITFYVDDDACPAPGSGTEADPFCAIQTALDVALDGDEILVEPGTYNETINFLGKAVALRSAAGRDVTTIDAAGLNDTVVRCVNGEGPDTLLDGFTITNGIGFNGGGMKIATPNTLTSPTIIRCRISNNIAANGGGGLFSIGGSPVVMDTIFIDNAVDDPTSAEGGIFSISNMMVLNCTFIRNHKTGTHPDGPSGSGAILTGGGMLVVANSLFIANTTVARGGATARDGRNDSYINCVFIANAADIQGDAIFAGENPTGEDAGMINCIFWDHDGPAIEGPGAGALSVTYSDVEGGYPGEGNINAPPMFVRMPSPGPDGEWGTDDDDFGDLHLREDSPCIDAGDRAAPNLPLLDLDEQPRVQGCFVDMGVYEFPMPEPITNADTDCDDDVDGVDFAKFALCFNKAGNPPRTLDCSAWAGGQLDFDGDNDVDGVDFAQFALCFNKAGNPPRTLGCHLN